MTSADTCYLYLMCIQEGDCIVGPVKVGITGSLSARLSQVQTGNPRKVVIAMYLPFPNRDIAATLEGGFHTVMGDHRLSGEWFDLHPVEALIAICQNVRSAIEHFFADQPDFVPVAIASCRLPEAEALLENIRVLSSKETIQ